MSLIYFTFLIYSKIAQYSPSEASKVYDKALQRRNIQPFNSKATIAILKEDTKVGSILNDLEKRILVERYLEVQIFIC
jgi:cohesin loading factor subunit SCC2